MLPEPMLTRLKDRLTTQTGLNFTGSGWHDFELRIAAAAEDAGAANVLTYANQLLSSSLSQEDIKILAQHLTVGETYFFRDKRSFDALATHVLPELLRSRELSHRQLRIWSAGCCTGEEAYSIAILLDRLLPQQDSWKISIVATDINTRFLEKAKQAIYGEWSFRGTPAWVQENYFTKRRNNTFELIPKIRQRVQFAYLNLADDVYPSTHTNTNELDAIFCRNVLMYFSAEQARRVVSRFRAAILESGLLLVNPAETSSTLFSAFSLVHYPGASFYRPENTSNNTSSPGDLQRQLAPTKPSGKTSAAATNIFPAKPTATSAGKTGMVAPSAAKKAVVVPTTTPEDSEGADSFARRARAAADEGNLDNAAHWCEQAIAADKLNPAFHFLLATIEQERGRYEAAIQALQRTLYLDGQYVLAHFALANLRLVEGRGKDAARHFEIVRKLLRHYKTDEILVESDGLTVGRLDEIAAFLAASLDEHRHTRVIP